MLYNSKTVALLLASTISLVTVVFLTLVENIPGGAYFVAGTLAFSSSFLLIYITLEFLIFKEIEKIYVSVNKLKSKELQLRRFEFSDNPFKKINQEIVSYISRKEKEIDELKRLENYRRDFVANVSHELKTPLFSAQGYVHTLLDGAMDDPEVATRFLNNAAKSLDALDALVKDLLTISQIESGVIVMKFSTFDLQQVIMDVCEQLEHVAEKKAMRLELLNPRIEGWPVSADRQKIQQVLTNLISNAIKYGKDSGLVSIDLKENTKTISLAVIDDGPGMAPEHLNRIFERFYRVDKSRSREQGGTGLGLSIVKHILEGHHKKITVKSEEGNGCTFSFKLDKKRDIVFEDDDED